MRLCYFVMCYRQPHHVERLLGALDDPRDRFILHVDSKAKAAAQRTFAAIADRFRNVELMPAQRLAWGHWSMADVHRRAMDFARQRPDWDYFINLSESCYPVRSVWEIHRVLAEGASQAGAPMPRPNYMAIDPLGEDAHAFRRWFMRRWIGMNANDCAIPLWSRRLPLGIETGWKGSGWSVLHRSFCDWLLDAPEASEVLRFLRHSKHAFEFWLPWAMMNGPFRASLRPGRHFVRWSPGQAHPDGLTVRDLPEIVGSGALFARKFDAARDPAVLDEIDRVRASPPDDRRLLAVRAAAGAGRRAPASGVDTPCPAGQQ